MKLTLHHINLATERVDEMDRFYQGVMSQSRETSGLPVLEIEFADGRLITSPGGNTTASRKPKAKSKGGDPQGSLF